MRITRNVTAPCGHRNPHGITIVHHRLFLCPHCAALRFFDLNQGLICEMAAREAAAGRSAEAKALCEMALACGPCPRKGGCRLAAAPVVEAA